MPLQLNNPTVHNASSSNGQDEMLSAQINTLNEQANFHVAEARAYRHHLSTQSSHIDTLKTMATELKARMDNTD